MNKLKFDFFNNLRKLCDFCKTITVFIIFLFIIYWIESISNFRFDWLNFIKPFFDNLLGFSTNILSIFSCQDSNIIFAASIILFIITITCFSYFKNLTYTIENIFYNSQKSIQNIKENFIHKNFQQTQKKEQLQICNYKITMKIKLKPKFSHKELQINISDENKILIDYLNNLLNKTPSQFEEGYMYSFDNFNEINKTLNIFNNIKEKFKKLDIAITVSLNEDIKILSKIFNLDYYNKIITTSSVIYRYKFNEGHQFASSPLGVYQIANETVELHELYKIKL